MMDTLKSCIFMYSGKSYTMLGRPDTSANLGAIPCAITWLFRGIAEQRHKCGTRFSIRVSAVELCTNTNQIRDLLAPYQNGKLFIKQKILLNSLIVKIDNSL